MQTVVCQFTLKSTNNETSRIQIPLNQHFETSVRSQVFSAENRVGHWASVFATVNPRCDRRPLIAITIYGTKKNAFFY